jgi:hypothetical protein
VVDAGQASIATRGFVVTHRRIAHIEQVVKNVPNIGRPAVAGLSLPYVEHNDSRLVIGRER